LPGSRRDGADPIKLQRQFAKYGTSTEGMPPPEVKRGSDGELVIYDGVTRAARVAKYLPGTPITVEVTGQLRGPVGGLPKVGDKL
jgi:Ser/Thr protein kinase RdoA (MazF antagonist)